MAEESKMDKLAYDLVVNDDLKIKQDCFNSIRKRAQENGIYPCSIQRVYEARAKDEFKGLTVPAINLRGLTYDLARAVIRAAIKNYSLTFIFEIAKSEIGYTIQRPLEYAGLVLAAAVREGFCGPLFIQADHFQINARGFTKDAKREIEGLKALIKEAIDSLFFNIDIDSSTLVDLTKSTVSEQQRLNFQVCAELTAYIRQNQPKSLTISIGGEIGEVGGKNSTVEELEAFMDGYLARCSELGVKKGISKISVQTGTTHGGVVLPDGSVAKVNLDFETLRSLSQVSREKYGLAGAVQHGASTLPESAFHKFPENQTTEVHLATQFQNMIYESKYFPPDLKKRMYGWLRANCAHERKEGQTEEQFIYKTRKKAFGPFKKELMDLPLNIRDAIGKELEEKFDFLFKQLNAVRTEDLVNKYIKKEETYLSS